MIATATPSSSATEDSASPITETCQIGSYPFFRDGRVGANFVIRSVDADDLAACTAELARALAEAGYPTTPGGI